MLDAGPASLLHSRAGCESFRPVDGYNYVTDLNVRFSETDAQGIANNSVYLNWFEVARIAYLARFPGGYRGLIEQGVEALTIEAHVRYLAPCGFDDQLRIHTRATHVRGARFRFEYVVERTNEPQTTIADGWTGHACVDATTLRPTRMPPWLAQGIAELESA
jgi:acyl-CoA thioester hydrolase